MPFLVALCAWENYNEILYITDSEDEQEILCMKCGNSTIFNPRDEEDDDE